MVSIAECQPWCDPFSIRLAREYTANQLYWWHTIYTIYFTLSLHPKTLKRWVRIFATTGVDGLSTFNYVGNTPWLTDDQIQQFTAWLDACVRSTKEAIAWVDEHFGLDYSESGMLKLLKRLDYRYKQPAQVPSKADPDAQAAWLERYSAKMGR
jgi:transposase